MHFSISDTEELLDAYGSSYTSYRLYCNGTFHGSVRYREFFDLHENLRSIFSDLPSFPPKKLFNLSACELSVRRQNLEKYMQNLGQVTEILHSEIFRDFLRRVQLKNFEDFEIGRNSVFLLNGNPIEFSVDPKITCDELLILVCQELKLPAELTNFFALFLAIEEEKKYSLFKKFADFEIPFAVVKLNSADEQFGSMFGRKKSLISVNGTGTGNGNGTGHATSGRSLKIVIRKSYWDSSYDTEILDSPSKVGTNLLFVEAVDCINRGWTVPTPEQKQHLESLQQKGSRKEFIKTARTVKGYGSVHFGHCTMDYPTQGTLTRPYLTGKDLVCPLKTSDGQVKQEAVFRVIRMRCWRLCLSETYKNGHSADHPQARMSLMFEYLLGRDKLQWISLHSEEAIWIGSCLQGMVEELMLQKKGLKINRPLGGSTSTVVKSTASGATSSESLSVSVTVTRNMTSGNSAFEEIRDEDL